MARKSSSRVPKSNVLDNVKKFFMDTENVVIVVLLVVLLVLVVYYVRQNTENFNERPTVYFFYVNWCPHCKNAKPEVAKFKKENKNVVVKEVDCEVEKDLARKFNVRAYPTVYLVKGEEKTELEEGISVDSLNRLVKNN